MAVKSWHLSRRELLRGGGMALALPFLNSMNWARAAATQDLPKRMVVCYFSYGAYMPKEENGQHHEWNWWPCKDPGPLTFNKSTAPFEPLKDYVSYLRGLDHAGGYALGGHSSGDVFATGADMVNREKTNNISIDQVAPRALTATRPATTRSSSEPKGGPGRTETAKLSRITDRAARSRRCTGRKKFLTASFNPMQGKVSNKSAPN